VTILSFLYGLNNEINLLIIISLISLLNRGESFHYISSIFSSTQDMQTSSAGVHADSSRTSVPTNTFKVCIGTKFNCVVTRKRNIFSILSIHGVITCKIQSQNTSLIFYISICVPFFYKLRMPIAGKIRNIS